MFLVLLTPSRVVVSFAPSKVHVFEVLCHVWVEPMVLVAISLCFLLLLFFSR